MNLEINKIHEADDHNKNLYELMLILGYDEPEKDIFELLEILEKKEKFYDFYVSIMELTHKLGDYKVLSFGLNSILKMNILRNYDCFSGLTLLNRTILEMYVQQLNIICKEKNEAEFNYEKRVINNFDKIFPEYEFIKNQYRIENLGIIDILAKHKTLGNPVIIELKIDGTNPKKQLLSYGSHFENPILVSLTKKECKNKYEKIKYVVFD